MQLSRGVHGFGANINEMVHLWTVYCRSVLEQSCVVWGSTLTLENTNDLGRTQKSFLKMILKSGIKYDKFNDLIT